MGSLCRRSVQNVAVAQGARGHTCKQYQRPLTGSQCSLEARNLSNRAGGAFFLGSVRGQCIHSGCAWIHAVGASKRSWIGSPFQLDDRLFLSGSVPARYSGLQMAEVWSSFACLSTPLLCLVVPDSWVSLRLPLARPAHPPLRPDADDWKHLKVFVRPLPNASLQVPLIASPFTTTPAPSLVPCWYPYLILLLDGQVSQQILGA